MKNWTKSQKLQFAAFMVAASRYTALGGMLIGIDLMRFSWAFQAFEVVSWFFFAILEGFALPYISRGMTAAGDKTGARRTLGAYRVILLLALPALGAPLYAAIATQQSILELLGWLYWPWAFLAAGLVAVIADAVGVVESVMPEQPAQESETARLFRGIIANGRVTPDVLAKQTGVSVALADAALTALHNGKTQNR